MLKFHPYFILSRDTRIEFVIYCVLIASSNLPGARGNLTKFGTTHDRFCGGQLNSESNEEESVPLYSEITSQIIWLQLVTGSRDLFAMQELEERSTNHRGMDIRMSV